MGDGGSGARSALAGVVAWTVALGVACDRGAADTPVRAAAAAKGGLGGGGGGAGGAAGEGGSATSAQGGGGGGAPAGGGGSGGGAAGAGGVDAGAVCVGCGKLLVVPDTDPASLCPEAQDKLDSFRDCICKTTCAALCGDNACAEEPATADCEACISTSCQDAYFACMADD